MNKLVRDKIVELLEKDGKIVDFEVLGQEDYLKALKEKIKEEAEEVFTAAPEKLLEELADTQEVIDCILETQGLTKEDLEKVQADKRKNKGSFKNKHFIKSVRWNTINPT